MLPLIGRTWQKLWSVAHDGLDELRISFDLVRTCDQFRRGLRTFEITPREELHVSLVDASLLAVSFLVFLYLLYALIFPERF